MLMIRGETGDCETTWTSWTELNRARGQNEIRVDPVELLQLQNMPADGVLSVCGSLGSNTDSGPGGVAAKAQTSEAPQLALAKQRQPRRRAIRCFSAAPRFSVSTGGRLTCVYSNNTSFLPSNPSEHFPLQERQTVCQIDV